MATLKCKMCGGTLEVSENEQIGICEYCGNTQTIPTLDNEKKILLHNKANTSRLKNEFDKAMVTYENIVEEFTEDSEAYWGLILCKYGIEYVDDPKTGKKVPTCHRTLTKSILNDDDYLNAIKYSDVIARSLYEKEAKEIDRLQKEILTLSQKEDPYDIFICYKETDNIGRRTIDSVIAQDIYDELTKKDYKVFFARITLESKLGSQYEPIIYAALTSSKVMLVIGTKPEYFNAVWVKNEWSRYIDMINHSNNRKYLIPCYKDMDAYDLPEEMLSYQCQDLNKLGYMQDLIRGLDKIFDRKEKVVEVVKERIVETKTNVQYVQGNSYQNTAIREEFVRITMYLEMGNFIEASKLVNKLLPKEMTNARLWIFSLLAQLQIKSEDLLGNHTTILTNYNQYNKALEYADNDYKQFLIESNNKVIKRKEEKRLENTYAFGLEYKNKKDYENAISKFQTIIDYKDSRKQIIECEELNKEVRLKIKNLINETIKKIVECNKGINIESTAKHHLKDSELEKYNINFSIDYDACGGEVSKKIPETNNWEKIIAIITSGVKKQYNDFVEWYIEELTIMDNESSYDVKIKIKAKFKKFYVIEYDTGKGKPEYRRFYNRKEITLEIPRENETNGLLFVGWYDENNKKITSIEEKNYKLKAKWANYIFDERSNNKRIYFGYAPIKGIDLNFDRYINEGEIITCLGIKHIKSSDWKYYALEPLLWDIVEQEGNKYKLVTTEVLISRQFHCDEKMRFKKFRTIKPNNYQLSDIRAYLNGLNGELYGAKDYVNYCDKGFVNVAFNYEQMRMINRKDIKELFNDFKHIPIPISYPFKGDYVYLLSAEDMKNPKINTIKNVTYMLRTPNDSKSIDICVNGKVEKGDPTEFYPIRLGMEITIKDEKDEE